MFATKVALPLALLLCACAHDPSPSGPRERAAWEDECATPAWGCSDDDVAGVDGTVGGEVAPYGDDPLRGEPAQGSGGGPGESAGEGAGGGSASPFVRRARPRRSL